MSFRYVPGARLGRLTLAHHRTGHAKLGRGYNVAASGKALRRKRDDGYVKIKWRHSIFSAAHAAAESSLIT